MEPESRNFVLTAAVTLLVVAVCVAAYDLLKSDDPQAQKPSVPVIVTDIPLDKPVELVVPPPVQPEPHAPSEPREMTIAAPKDGAFEMTRQIDPVMDAAGRADRLRIKINRGEFMFHLCGIEALAHDQANPQTLRDQASYFHQSPSRILTLGTEAYKETIALLREKPVTLFTRWEPAGGPGHYYGWLLVEHKPGVRSYLSEILVARGQAFVTGPPREAPVGNFTPASFLERLQGHEARAKKEKIGAWGD